MAAPELDLQEDLNDLRPARKSQPRAVRPKVIQVSWEPPNKDDVVAWALALTQGGHPLLGIKGPTPAHRQQVYNWAAGGRAGTFQDWLKHGPINYMTGRLLSPGCEPLSLLRDLTRDELVVTEPLHGLVDRGFRFTELFKALWEAYFLRRECRNEEYDDLLSAIFRWLVGADLHPDQAAILRKAHITRDVSTPREQLDLLFFLVALAKQNELLHQEVVIFDGIDQAVRQGDGQDRKNILGAFLTVCEAAERWSKLGAATGLIFGYDPSRGALNAIQRYNRKLSQRISAVSV